MMSHTHKRLYFNKNKKPNKLNIKSDPISDGVRNSLINKVNNLYDQIARLHNQSTPVK
jgi:hypothetical protein